MKTTSQIGNWEDLDQILHFNNALLDLTLWKRPAD